MNWAAFLDRLRALSPGSKIAVNGNRYTVGKGAQDVAYPTGIWTRVPFMLNRGLKTETLWLEVPPHPSDSNPPVWLRRCVGKYDRKADDIAADKSITWRKVWYAADSVRSMEVSDRLNPRTRVAGVFILCHPSRPHGSSRPPLCLEKLHGQKTWLVYEQTMVVPETVHFL